MIRIFRGQEPELFRNNAVKLAVGKLEEFYFSEDRSQRRYDFPFNNDFDGVLKPHLREMFHGKCGYCEVNISHSDDAVVDRFRPFSGIRDKTAYYPDLYWWLTFNWENLIYSCKECQQYKANYFPIDGVRAMTIADNLEKENCLLVDPCADDPNLHFSYDKNGIILPLTLKGKQTIELLRLDRPARREQRLWERFRIEELLLGLAAPLDLPQEDHQEFAGIVNEDPGIEFLGFKKWYVWHVLRGNRVLQESLKIEPIFPQPGEAGGTTTDLHGVSVEDIVVNDYFPIESIRIQHFKGITDLTIHFKEDGISQKSWLFLLGENGVGKSSILQAIAVGIKANISFLTPLLSSLIQKGEERAEITIKERDSDNVITTVLTRESIDQTGTFKSFLLGYGSLRLSTDVAEERSGQDEAGISYENLFRPIRPLNDITAWLKNLYQENPRFFDVVAYSIKQLLPHDFIENKLTVEEGGLLFRGSEKSFAELSDGFKSTIVLTVDIMMKLSSAHADMDKMSGIVLIDELGNQLHPRWQMRIVKQLRTVFKNINFIVSTHHPLCLRGSESEEVLLLKNKEEVIVPVTDLPDPASLRVDQILASEFFGLSSLIDPELEAQFNRYYALLAREDSITAEERRELDGLKDALRNQKQMGVSLREELMYTVIDRLLASQLVYNNESLSRAQLKEEVVQRVKQIWDTLNIDDYDQG
jgi:uncharacterized protein (TIGR02646 family)